MFVCILLVSQLLYPVLTAPTHIEPARLYPVVTRYATKVDMPQQHPVYVVPVATETVVTPTVTKTVTPVYVKTFVVPVNNHKVHQPPVVHNVGGESTMIAHTGGSKYTLYGQRDDHIYIQGDERSVYGDAGTKVYAIYAYSDDRHPVYATGDSPYRVHAVTDEHGHIVYMLRREGSTLYATPDGHVHVISAPENVHSHNVHAVNDGHGHVLFVSRDSQGRLTIFTTKNGHVPALPTHGGDHGITVYSVQFVQGQGVPPPGYIHGTNVYTSGTGQTTIYTSGTEHHNDAYPSSNGHSHTVYTVETGIGHHAPGGEHILTASAPESGHSGTEKEGNIVHTIYVTRGIGQEQDEHHAVEHSHGHVPPTVEEEHKITIHTEVHKHEEPAITTSDGSEGKQELAPTPTLTTSEGGEGESVAISTDGDTNVSVDGGTIVTADEETGVSVTSENGDSKPEVKEDESTTHKVEEKHHEDTNAGSNHESVGDQAHVDSENKASNDHDAHHDHIGNHGQGWGIHGHGHDINIYKDGHGTGHGDHHNHKNGGFGFYHGRGYDHLPGHNIHGIHEGCRKDKHDHGHHGFGFGVIGHNPIFDGRPSGQDPHQKLLSGHTLDHRG